MFAFRHLLSVCQTVHENYMKTDRHHDSQITGCYVMILVWIDGALLEGSLIALKKEKDTLSLYCIYLNVLTFLQRLDKKTLSDLSLTKSFSLGPQVSHGTTDVTTDRQVVQYRLPTTDSRRTQHCREHDPSFGSATSCKRPQISSFMGVTADRRFNRYKQLYRDPPTDPMCEYLASTSQTPVDTSR